jgi:glycine/D-amino acid oxidase-like deaminating enzyme
MSNTWDSIIAGGGGSRLTAAVSAVAIGCSVLVLDKPAPPGGTTGMAAASFTANRTDLQRKAGIAEFQGSRWGLLGPAKSDDTTTEGGPAINRRFEVLDAAA